MTGSAPAFTIRPAVAEDYAGVCAVLDEVDRLHRDQLPWIFREPPEPPRSLEDIEKLIEDPASALFVAEADKLVGVAIGFLREAPKFGVFIPQSWCVIDAIGVTASWQRKGVGRDLIRAVEQWGRALDAQWFELGVYDFNEGARRFYERIGYVPVSTKLRKPL